MEVIQKAGRNNFVAPLKELATRQIIHLDSADMTVLPPAATTNVELRASYVDRAKGFQIASVPLAAAVGAGSLIIGIVGAGVPLFSVAALAWLWGGFLATWLIAWAIHNVVSPDGISLIHTILGWRYLRREQIERHKRYQ